jgi:hypothetical protein
MSRRSLVGAGVLSLVTVLPMLGGCESSRPFLRSKDSGAHHASFEDETSSSDVDSVESDPLKLKAVDSDPKNPQPFFKNNRRPGTWSSEAREVESHLGIQ